MTYAQGDVVVAADPFGPAPRRRYLVVSDDSQPFQGEDYLAAGIATTARPEGIPLVDEYEVGELDRESFVSPWTRLTIRHDHVSKRVALGSSRVVVVGETSDAIATSVAAA